MDDGGVYKKTLLATDAKFTIKNLIINTTARRSPSVDYELGFVLLIIAFPSSLIAQHLLLAGNWAFSDSFIFLSW